VLGLAKLFVTGDVGRVRAAHDDVDRRCVGNGIVNTSALAFKLCSFGYAPSY
jgi:hypothetical protein